MGMHGGAGYRICNFDLTQAAIGVVKGAIAAIVHASSDQRRVHDLLAKDLDPILYGVRAQG